MNYELAKELKEARFPQTVGHEKVFHTYAHFIGGPADDEELYPQPTLSELIEACGDGFWTLSRSSVDSWIATDGVIRDCVGATPEEAVARLWLALNT